MAEKIIRPQPGPQTIFLSNQSDIVIYGGAAGGGKTFSLLLEPLRHIHNPNFRGVVFRRTSPQIRNVGGLWDESSKIYAPLGLRGRESALDWVSGNGWHLKFSHLEHESDKFNWQGSQMSFLGFDEITHFSESQVFYLLSRLRSVSGVKGYVRATCNPDSGSWLADFLEWWIDQDSGLAIPERSGKVRWFVRINDSLEWADYPSELIEKFGNDSCPKSVCFISASVHDNQILLSHDPGYLANLKCLPLVERERLLGGNWKISYASRTVFKSEWFKIVNASDVPKDGTAVRFWDRAATPKNENNNPDWTVGCKVRKSKSGSYWVEDVIRFRGSPAKVHEMILETAKNDGIQVWIGLPQDPGQAGVVEIDFLKNVLKDFNVKVVRETGSKISRCRPLSATAENQGIYLVRGNWNSLFVSEIESFPDGIFDDQLDAFTGAFNLLCVSFDPVYRCRRI